MTQHEMTLKVERMSFGKCVRCNQEEAHYASLKIGDQCFKEWVKLAKIYEPGSNERRMAVLKFFEGN